MLTDSYQKIDEGFLSLSGRSVGADGVAKETIAALTGGDAVVTFKAFDDAAKKLIEDRLEQPYTENEEGFLIAADGTGVTVYADSDRAKLYAACSIADKYTGQKMPKGLWWSYPACAIVPSGYFCLPKRTWITSASSSTSWSTWATTPCSWRLAGPWNSKSIRR